MIKEFIIGKRYSLKFNPQDLPQLYGQNYLVFKGTSTSKLYYRYKLSGGTLTSWTLLPQIANELCINFEQGNTMSELRINSTLYSYLVDISLCDYFEITGTLIDEEFDSGYDESIELKNFLLQRIVDASVQFTLMVNGEEKIVVSKSPTFVDYMWGTFKNEVDIMNPSFIIESDVLPKFNYLKCENLNRFYYVNNIVIVRNGLYRIDCHVDVLNTYDTEINAQTDCFILRSEIAGVPSLVDSRRPVVNVPEITFTDVTGGSLSNISFDDNYLQSGSEKRFYVLALRDLTQQKNNLPAPTGSGLPTISDKTSDHESRYILTYTQFSRLLKGLYNNSALSSYVENIIYLPFDFDDLTTTYIADKLMVNDKYLKVDSSWTSDGSDVQIQSCNGWGYPMPYLIVADFSISADYSDEQSYLNVEPYTRYDIYLPFIGWVNLPSIDVVGKDILVYYAMNEEDGTGTCYVKNTTDEKIVYSGTCQIGVRIGVDYTNALELSAQKNANVMNGVLGSVAGALSIGVGVFTGKPLAAVGGVMQTAKTIENSVNRDAMMFEKAQTQVNGSSNAMYGDITNVILKKSHLAPLTIDEDVYRHMNGYPMNQYDTLATYSGGGYVECVIHWASSNDQITSQEIDEIESLAKGGIII